MTDSFHSRVWNRPTADALDLSAGLVHVWRFTLDPPDSTLAQFEPLLDPTERTRADRFRAATLRRRFVAGRGGLRTLLGTVLNSPARSIAFAYGDHGKPRLADAHPSGVEFNLTHSHGLALCAVTIGQAIGVDLEAIRPLENAERIIGRFFSPVEQAEFLRLAEADRRSAFFRGWSRKEAFLKATGTGLSTALDSFDVTLGPLPRLLRVGNDPIESTHWTLLDLHPDPTFASALATRSLNVSLQLWDGLPDL